MKSRNLTLNLPDDLIRRAKVHAARHETTINGFVRQLLEEALSQTQRTRATVKRALELIRSGPYSEVDPASISREEIHDRW